MMNWFKKQQQELKIDVLEVGIDMITDWRMTNEGIKHISNNYHRSVFLKAWDRVRKTWVDRFLIAPILTKDNLYGVALLAKRNNRYLVQAKAEPGNNTPNHVQLTSTIHASYGNIKNKLSGEVPFTWMYDDPRCIDVTVSQDGAQLYLKTNAVCYIEITEDIDIPDNYYWATREEIQDFASLGLVSEHLMQCLGLEQLYETI
jgi:hypothetical protein